MASDYVVQKGDLFDLPMRLLITGGSYWSERIDLLANFLLRPFSATDHDLYANNFSGKNIYIVGLNDTETLNTIISHKQIPKTNIYSDTEGIDLLYDKIETDFRNAQNDGKTPEHTLVIMEHNFTSPIFMNGRGFLISSIVLSKKYSQIPISFRENCTGLIVLDSDDDQLESIYKEHGVPDMAKPMRGENTPHIKCPRVHFMVNYSNPIERRFLQLA